MLHVSLELKRARQHLGPLDQRTAICFCSLCKLVGHSSFPGCRWSARRGSVSFCQAEPAQSLESGLELFVLFPPGGTQASHAPS